MYRQMRRICIGIAVAGLAVAAMGEALSLVWGEAARPGVRRGTVKVTGEGTLTLTRNGVAALAIPPDGIEAFAFTFAFEGEGSADLYGFSAKVGAVFSIR